MASTTFASGVVISSDWLNAIDAYVYSVQRFGATGNGSTDDTAAIQAALNSDNKRVYFPTGTYKISAPLTVPTQVHVIGESRWTTNIFSTDVDANILTLTNTSDNQIQNIHLSYSGTPIAGANAISVSNCQTCSFLNLWISSSWNGISITGGGNHSIIDYRCYSYENNAILFTTTLDCNLTNFRFHAGDSIKGRLGGIRLVGGCEAITASQGDITLGVYSMTQDQLGSTARGSAPYFNKFHQIYFDSPLLNPVFLDGVSHTNFVDCWIASAGHNEAVGFGSATDQVGMSLDQCEFITITGGEFYNNGGVGLLIGGSCRFIRVVNTAFKRNQFSRVVDGAAISVLPNVTDFGITNCQFERDADTVTYRMTRAIDTSGTSDRYFIADNLLGGTTVNDTATGVNKRVENNY